MASGPRIPLSTCENLSTSLVSLDKDDEDKCTEVAKEFVDMMDHYLGWAPDRLHEDAVMDWFGRYLLGRNSIIYFLRSHVSKTRHVIDRVSRIAPVSHRLIKMKTARKSRKTQALPSGCNEPSSEECGQGDCKGFCTPENPVLPNMKELVKAPRMKRPTSYSVDWEQCEFLEIRGNLEFDGCGSMQSRGEKKLDRIILAYTDQIHLVIYEGKNNCRKKLFS